jgi:hypothetical protein
MGEPSKRTWPWKKRLQDKAVSAPDVVEPPSHDSPQITKVLDEQVCSQEVSTGSCHDLCILGIVCDWAGFRNNCVLTSGALVPVHIISAVV